MSKKILKLCTFQLNYPDKFNCLFDSVLFFFPMKPPGYKGASLRLQLVYEMALHPDEYKVQILHNINNYSIFVLLY